MANINNSGLANQSEPANKLNATQKYWINVAIKAQDTFEDFMKVDLNKKTRDEIYQLLSINLDPDRQFAGTGLWSSIRELKKDTLVEILRRVHNSIQQGVYPDWVSLGKTYFPKVDGSTIFLPLYGVEQKDAPKGFLTNLGLGIREFLSPKRTTTKKTRSNTPDNTESSFLGVDLTQDLDIQLPVETPPTIAQQLTNPDQVNWKEAIQQLAVTNQQLQQMLTAANASQRVLASENKSLQIEVRKMKQRQAQLEALQAANAQAPMLPPPAPQQPPQLPAQLQPQADPQQPSPLTVPQLPPVAPQQPPPLPQPPLQPQTAAAQSNLAAIPSSSPTSTNLNLQPALPNFASHPAQASGAIPPILQPPPAMNQSSSMMAMPQLNNNAGGGLFSGANLQGALMPSQGQNIAAVSNTQRKALRKAFKESPLLPGISRHGLWKPVYYPEYVVPPNNHSLLQTLSKKGYKRHPIKEKTDLLARLRFINNQIEIDAAAGLISADRQAGYAKYHNLLETLLFTYNLAQVLKFDTAVRSYWTRTATCYSDVPNIFVTMYLGSVPIGSGGNGGYNNGRRGQQQQQQQPQRSAPDRQSARASAPGNDRNPWRLKNIHCACVRMNISGGLCKFGANCFYDHVCFSCGNSGHWYATCPTKRT
mmetsp:Transcript_19083/g.21262  ORF Transcript_19083/g.21262 Transcript_19083/m.21262 type:complete len:647 (+) Transcript_19083:335-2275(+)